MRTNQGNNLVPTLNMSISTHMHTNQITRKTFKVINKIFDIELSFLLCFIPQRIIR